MNATWKRETWVAAVSAASWTLLWTAGTFAFVDDPAGDLLLRLPRPDTVAATQVTAVVIDDGDLESLGPLPWPRRRHARLIEEIRRRGARGIAVDILLADPVGAGDGALARALGGDTVLAAALRAPDTWVLPLDRFGGAARAAHVHGESAGGVLRGVAATKQGGDLALPALALAAARLAGHDTPYRPGELLRPDFRVRPREVPLVPARALLDGTAGDGRIRGRLVFVGVTAAGAADQLAVPTSGRPVPGVLVHAALAESLLRGALLRPLPAAAVLLAAFLPAWALQRLRTREGRLRLTHPTLLAGAVIVAAPSALWILRVLLPWTLLLLTLLTSALLREILESRDARHRAAADRGARRRMAHELKTPLASVAGFGEMLERYELDRDELRRVAGLIRGESERLGDLVAGFLDLERLGQRHGERRPIDLAALAERRRQVLQAAAGEREIRLESSEAATVSGAEDLLERLLDNLVGNALKHAATDVDVRVGRRGRQVLLEVSDHGPGIPPDALPLLFERFYRVPGTSAPGSGLGLAWVREIANWHEGCVEVDSRPGAGTTFSVVLPASAARVEP